MDLNSREVLRILVLSSHFYPKVDGTSRSIDKIIKNLVRAGHHVSFMTRRFAKTPSFEIYENVEVYRIGPSGFSIFARLLFGINQARLAAKILIERRVDILQAHGFASMVACFILKTLFRRPIVLFFHGLPRMWIGEFKWRKPYEMQLSLPLERFLIRQADRIVVRSDLFAKTLAEVYGSGFEHKIRVLPHPVDTSIFSFSRPSLIDRVVLFVGSLAKVYGVDLLLKAATFVLQRIPEAIFVIVGDGPLDGYLRNLTHELDIEKAVRFVGRIDDPMKLAEYYRKSSVVVIPLYYRGYILSLVAVEALACGRPVVTTMTLEPGLEGVGVFTVQEPDPRQLAEAILRVFSESVNREALAFSAREYVEQRHSEKAYGARLESIYLELVHKGIHHDQC